MQRDVKTPAEYLDQLEDDWRRDRLQSLRSIIQKQAPEFTECISHKMLGYAVDGIFAFHLNVQQAYVSLYVGNAAKIDPTGELLHGLSVGKGCIRFSKSTDIAQTRIENVISRAIEIWRLGEGGEC